MSSLCPWPDEFMLPRAWAGIQRLLHRCLALAGEDALPHPLLLLGEPGLGREAFALELAAGLICPDGGGLDCTCRSCARLRRCVHPDLEIVGVAAGSQEIKIEQAREIVKRLPQLPFEGRRRVILLTSAHTPPLNVDTASALLKALEEPPPHVIFLLLAANPARVIPTVLSRSLRLRIPPPTEEELRSFVADLHAVDEAQAETLVAQLDGDLRLLVRKDGRSLPAVLEDLRTRLADALAGDTLALVTAAAMVQRLPRGFLLAVSALLSGLASTPVDGQEATLDAAARLLVAARRREILRLTPEAAACAALSPLVLAARRRASPGGHAAAKKVNRRTLPAVR